MSTGLANPAEMIAHGAPRVIHNDVELEAYTDALFQLTALENPSSFEVEAIELLTLLVERYEQEHSAIPMADPISIVRLLIEQQGLTQRDLIPQFGSESAVSMFLGGATKTYCRASSKIERPLRTSHRCFHSQEPRCRGLMWRLR